MKNKNLYIILGLLGVGGLIWYFKRKQTTTTTTETTAEDLNKFLDIAVTQPTRSQGVVMNIRNNVVESPTTITPTSDTNYLSILTNQNLNYNYWYDQLKLNRSINTNYQNTKETQPLPFTPENTTIPLAKGWVFEWVDIDNTINQTFLNTMQKAGYNYRWKIVYKP
jgi:hypothetical protein